MVAICIEIVVGYNPDFTNNNNNNNNNSNSKFKYHEDYEPIDKMFTDKSYKLSIRNLEDTKYRDWMFSLCDFFICY